MAGALSCSGGLVERLQVVAELACESDRVHLAIGVWEPCMGWRTRTIAVPRGDLAQAIVALHSAGYKAEATNEQPRDVHPGWVVIATERFFEDEQSLKFHPDQPPVDPRATNGVLNREIGNNALRAAGVEFAGYSYGGEAQGGTAAHRYLQVIVASTSQPVCKVLAATEDDVIRELDRAAEEFGLDRDDLTVVEPPDWIDRPS